MIDGFMESPEGESLDSNPSFDFEFSGNKPGEKGYLSDLKEYQNFAFGQIQQESKSYLSQMSDILSELEKRQMSAVNLYQPIPFQERYHRSTTGTVILRKGNRSGGSVCGFMEDARCALGLDPYKKWPKKGTIICLGYGESHIANVIYKLLFAPGAFDIIKDEETGQWRTFRNWFTGDEVGLRLGLIGDRGREDDMIDSPPFIEPKYIHDPVWVSKGGRIFKEMRIINPQTGSDFVIVAANSNGDPKHMQGFNSDLFHIDEDVANEGWVEEQTARLIKRKGRTRWTAMPHGDNNILQGMVDIANDELQLPEKERTVELITATIFDNPYLPRENVDAFAKKMGALGEDIYNKRVLGEYNNTQTMVYDKYSERVHCPHSKHSDKSKASIVYKENGFWPPEDWTRYWCLDPGHSVCAVVYCACPPPSLGNQIFFYDEIYQKQSDSKSIIKLVGRKNRDQTIHEALIDAHGGRLTSVAGGDTPQQMYEAELELQNISAINSGYGFFPGMDKIAAREEMTRQRMATYPDDPGMMIDTKRCPNLHRELLGFRKLKHKDIITDKANRKLPCHAIECMEYLCGHDCSWVTPPEPVVVSFQEMIKNEEEYYRKKNYDYGENSGESTNFGGMSR